MKEDIFTCADGSESITYMALTETYQTRVFESFEVIYVPEEIFFRDATSRFLTKLSEE